MTWFAHQPTERGHDDPLQEALNRARAHSRVEGGAHKLRRRRVVEVHSDLALLKRLAELLQLNLDC